MGRDERGNTTRVKKRKVCGGKLVTLPDQPDS